MVKSKQAFTVKNYSKKNPLVFVCREKYSSRSVKNEDDNFYPQIYLEERRYEEKESNEKKRHIKVEIEL